MASFSADCVNEIGLELRDVFPAAEDLLYYFINAKRHLRYDEVAAILDQSALRHAEYASVIEALMWYGVLGVIQPLEGDLRETYIYNVYYDMKKLQRLADGLGQGKASLSIHPIFWPFLEVRA